ncbi:membrane protein [Microbacterium phage Triscuit]|nr:membrane protein [Microbacterium phage Triscuit]
MVQSNTNEMTVVHRSRITSIIRRIGWLNFKLALGGWAFVMMVLPPIPVVGATGFLLHALWTGSALAGAIISAVGIIMSFWRSPRVYKASVAVELGGLSLLFIGPAIYLFTQLGLTWSDPPESIQSRLALVFFAWAMVCAVLARIVTVVPRFHKE